MPALRDNEPLLSVTLLGMTACALHRVAVSLLPVVAMCQLHSTTECLLHCTIVNLLHTEAVYVMHCVIVCLMCSVTECIQHSVTVPAAERHRVPTAETQTSAFIINATVPLSLVGLSLGGSGWSRDTFLSLLYDIRDIFRRRQGPLALRGPILEILCDSGLAPHCDIPMLRTHLQSRQGMFTECKKKKGRVYFCFQPCGLHRSSVATSKAADKSVQAESNITEMVPYKGGR